MIMFALFEPKKKLMLLAKNNRKLEILVTFVHFLAIALNQMADIGRALVYAFLSNFSLCWSLDR